jgi:hypothetical protein
MKLDLQYILAHYNELNTSTAIICTEARTARFLADALCITRSTYRSINHNGSTLGIYIVRNYGELMYLSGMQFTHISVQGIQDEQYMSRVRSRVRSATYKGKMTISTFQWV